MSHSTIRTFRAGSVREALAKVRAAFGPEAVVLQATEIPGNMFRKPEFEVMAALDDSQLPGQATASDNNPAIGQANHATNLTSVPEARNEKPGPLNNGLATSYNAAAKPVAPTPAQQPLHQSLPLRDPRAPLASARTPEPAAPWFAQPAPTNSNSHEPAFAREPRSLRIAPESHQRGPRQRLY